MSRRRQELVYGSYFQPNLSGYGADDQSISIADQAMLTLVQGTPSLTYSEWAEQTGDASWAEVTPTTDYQAYAVTDAQIQTVVNGTSSEVTSLAVISPVLQRQGTVDQAFQGTPFSYQRTEAVYATSDTNSPPTIYFLYWLTLRDGTDPKAGQNSLVATATLLAGVLAYVLQIPSSPRQRPAVTFASAYAAQSARSPLTIPPTVAQSSTTPAGPVAPPLVLAPPSAAPPQATSTAPSAALAPASSGDTVKAVLLVGLGAAAAVAAYHYVQKRRAAS